jgi:hypothetical protein
MSEDLDKDRALGIDAVGPDFGIVHQDHDALAERSPQRLAEDAQNDRLGRDLHPGVGWGAVAVRRFRRRPRSTRLRD